MRLSMVTEVSLQLVGLSWHDIQWDIVFAIYCDFGKLRRTSTNRSVALHDIGEQMKLVLQLTLPFDLHLISIHILFYIIREVISFVDVFIRPAPKCNGGFPRLS